MRIYYLVTSIYIKLCVYKKVIYNFCDYEGDNKMDSKYDKNEFDCFKNEYDFMEEIDCSYDEMDYGLNELKCDCDEMDNGYEDNNSKYDQKNNCSTEVLEKAYKEGFEKGKAEGFEKGCKVGKELGIKQFIQLLKKNRCCIKCHKRCCK